MDWKPFVCRVSCSKIKQKTCFSTEGAPIYWSLGSNIMEPGLQYIGADQIFVLQNRLVGLKYSFAITQMRLNKTQSIWIGLIQLRKGFSKIFDGLQYIGARAPLHWSLGYNILEPLWFTKHVFCLFQVPFLYCMVSQRSGRYPETFLEAAVTISDVGVAVPNPIWNICLGD